MADWFINDEDWIQDEIARLEVLPCLCEPCVQKGCRYPRGCDACDGQGFTTRCERCEQLSEMKMAQQHAIREIHGHFGSGHS